MGETGRLYGSIQSLDDTATRFSWKREMGQICTRILECLNLEVRFIAALDISDVF